MTADTMKLLYVRDRKKWRDWLKKHYKTEKEIWLVYYKKETGKARVSYNDAVEEALCFGWIDSTIRTIDRERFGQRFSRRRPRSSYSQANKERLKKLIRQRKVMKDVLAALEEPADKGFKIPPDILKAVRANKEAWKHFRTFSPSYRRIRIAFIDGARKRPEEFEKRLRYFIRMTEKNKRFGFGGIGKYY
ncbi:hypothetical protein EHM92_02195 [bacterium]|nr:MAG: hypothetical protein EHM92_02195 [bacterium]